MDSYLVTMCSDCTAIWDAIERIDCTLHKYGKNRYINNSFLTRKVFPRDKIKLLSRYRVILEDLTWNPDAYIPFFPATTIISRVKALTNGL